MKKTYIIPTLNVVKIQPAQILAGSDLETKSGTATEWGGARRARFSDWDEDYDFEEE